MFNKKCQLECEKNIGRQYMLRTQLVTNHMSLGFTGHSCITFIFLWTVTKTLLFDMDILTRSPIYKQKLVTRSWTADETVARERSKFVILNQHIGKFQIII